MNHWKDMAFDVRKAEIVRLDAMGMGLVKIAEELGTTKNALWGFCWRHKISSTNKTVNKTPPASGPVLEPAAAERPDAWLPVGPVVTWDAMASSHAGESTCRWPVDGGWCGCARHKRGSYCETHTVMSRGEVVGDVDAPINVDDLIPAIDFRRIAPISARSALAALGVKIVAEAA